MSVSNCFLFCNIKFNVIKVLGLDKCHTLKANSPPERYKKIINLHDKLSYFRLIEFADDITKIK